jgi:serine/threonine protein kinase
VASPDTRADPELALDEAVDDARSEDDELDETTRHERPGLRRVRTDAPSTLRLQSRYRESRPIGKGGMSTVHRVTDAVVGRRVAVKMFKVGGPVTREDEERFIEEARITGQLEHPNIVPIHDLCVDDADQPPYFTMKLVQGRTLTEMIREHAHEPLTVAFLEPLLEAFLRVCDAIAYAHTRGVIHRDLKPENIMVGSHGQVYVMDWGVARLMPRATNPDESVQLRGTATRDERGSIIGTMIYMSPEQAMGLTDEVDERTDVFGLGAMLYAILTARPLVHGPHAHRGALRRPARSRDPAAGLAAPHRAPPPELCRIVMKAVSADARPTAISGRRGPAARRRRIRPRGRLVSEQTSRPAPSSSSEGDPGDDAYIIVQGDL